MPKDSALISFNELFNNLHRVLTELLETSEKRDFYSCILDIRNRGEHSALFAKLDDRYLDDLKTINSIRNIVIHKNDWIEITPKTIQVIKDITDGITRIEKNFHKRAIEVFGKKIFSAKDSDTLASLIEAVGSRNFSHVPVYTDAGKFRGVFSLKSLALWLNNQKYLIDKNIPLKEVTIDTKKSEYLFISNDTPVSEIDGYFVEYSLKRKKLGAIFLTRSGSETDAIEGIITAWDLPAIYEQIHI